MAVVSLLSLPDEVLYTIVYFWVTSCRVAVWPLKDISYSWVVLARVNRRFKLLVRRSGGFYNYLSILDPTRNMKAMYRAFDTKYTQRLLHMNVYVGTHDRLEATRDFLEENAGRLVELNMASALGLGHIALPAVKAFVGKDVSLPHGLSVNMRMLRLDGCNARMDGDSMFRYLNTMPSLTVLSLNNIIYKSSGASMRSSDVIPGLFLPQLAQMQLDLRSVEHQEMLLAIENSEAYPDLGKVWFTHLPDEETVKIEAIRSACRLLQWNYQQPVILLADLESNSVVQGDYNMTSGQAKRTLRVLNAAEISWLLLFQEKIKMVDFACEEAVERFCCQGYRFRTVSFLYPMINNILKHATLHYPEAKCLVLRCAPGEDEDNEELEEEDAQYFWADHTQELMCALPLRTIAVHGAVRRRDVIRRNQPSYAWMHPVVQYVSNEARLSGLVSCMY